MAIAHSEPGSVVDFEGRGVTDRKGRRVGRRFLAAGAVVVAVALASAFVGSRVGSSDSSEGSSDPSGVEASPAPPTADTVPPTTAGSETSTLDLNVETRELSLESLFSNTGSVDQLQGLALAAIVADGAGNFSIVDGIGGVQFGFEESDDETIRPVIEEWGVDRELSMALIIPDFENGSVHAITNESTFVDPASGEAGVVGVYMPRRPASELLLETPTFSVAEDSPYSSYAEAVRGITFLPGGHFGDELPTGSFASLLPPELPAEE